MRDWFVGQYGEEWYDKFTQAAADCEAEVDAEIEKVAAGK